jgi:co-chaperonin GroES (HSP10)
MKVEDLKTFLPRKSGVVLKSIAKSKSGIILPGQADYDTSTHTFVVVSMGPKVEDLKEGEEVYPMAAALATLTIDDCGKDEAYFYCEDSFLKLHKVTN